MFNGTIQQKISSKAENFKILKIWTLEEFTMGYLTNNEIKYYQIRTRFLPASERLAFINWCHVWN